MQHAVEQRAQFVLPVARHQEVPESAEAAALVGLVDEVALTQDVLQQRALAAVPQRDAFAHPPVQAAEVVFHLAEVGQQLARQRGELREALLQCGVAQQRHVAGAHALDLGVDDIAPALQFLYAHLGIGLAAFAHLAQQLEQRQQARLGADEAAFAQRAQPGQRLLGGGREVEVRLVRARRVELAQPGLVVRRPVVQVFERRLRMAGGPALFTHGVERVVQRRCQLGLVDHTPIGQHEHAVQKARHQSGRIGLKQTPCRVLPAQGLQGVDVERHRPSIKQRRVSSHRAARAVGDAGVVLHGVNESDVAAIVDDLRRRFGGGLGAGRRLRALTVTSTRAFTMAHTLGTGDCVAPDLVGC